MCVFQEIDTYNLFQSLQKAENDGLYNKQPKPDEFEGKYLQGVYKIFDRNFYKQLENDDNFDMFNLYKITYTLWLIQYVS